MIRSVLRRLSQRIYTTSTITTPVLSLILAGTSVGAPRFPSHCTNTETIVFSCKLHSSQKYISLCGSRSLHAPDAYLIYRFGALNHKEFVYPADAVGSLQKFKAAHYFRAQVDRRDVSFTNSNVTYHIFSYFEGEESRPHREGGVTITMAGKSKDSKTLQCAAPYFDKLEILDGVVMKGPDYLDDDE